MPDLLIELFSEEIPARMQRQAAQDLKRLVTAALVERNLMYEGAQSFVTPRRLTLHVVGLPAAQAPLREERKGPRVGAPEAAIQGFLKSAGLTRIEDARIETDPKKGAFYVAVIEKPGRETKDAIAEIIPEVINAFPWPKSMRWGDYQPAEALVSLSGVGEAEMHPGTISAKFTGRNKLRWVRPLRGIVCTLATQHETAEIVHFDLDAHGLKSGNTTWGHRFMAPQAIEVRRYDDYVDALMKAKVVLDADRRKAIILADAKDLAFAQGLTLIEDEGLLEEVAGLVEWPVVLMGEFEPAFLDLPPEVIRATIRANQKCFVLRDGAGKLANKFILVSNLVAPDDGKAIAAGNGRVVRARLADARHFWATDLAALPDAKDRSAKPLDQRLEKLNRVVFHEKLGTQGERIARIEALAKELAPIVGADPNLAERAAHLAKADLATEMVGEFPELQGLMGRYYASKQHEPSEVAAAIEEHYKPQGPNDRIPTAPVSIAVALADKLDTLVGFWAIDEKPTGSKDPYALRRAALGVIRIVLENAVRLPLDATIDATFERIEPCIEPVRSASKSTTFDAATGESRSDYQAAIQRERLKRPSRKADLLAFIADRLKIYLRETGTRHDLIDAVFALLTKKQSELLRFIHERLQEAGAPPSFDEMKEALDLRSKSGIHRLIMAIEERGFVRRLANGDRAIEVLRLPGQDDLLMIVRRVEALAALLDTEDGKNLLIGYRRAANILRAEEKKDGAQAFAGKHDPALLALPAERHLAEAIAKAGEAARERVEKEDFEGAMRALASLRAPVDAFFLDVTVNADEPALRLNRLRLLNELREAMHGVADFSKVAG